MSDQSNSLRLEVVGVLRNRRRRYDPVSKQRLVEACLQSGVSVAKLALQHGVNANLLRKWVAAHQQQQQQRNGVAAGAIERAREAFVPVVEIGALQSLAMSRQSEPMTPAPSPPLARLAAQLPNGVTVELACTVRDGALVAAMIKALGTA